MSSVDAGGNPGGVMSAAIPSMRTYETGGFIAVLIPFFSEVLLPTEAGAPSEITDHRHSAVPTTWLNDRPVPRLDGDHTTLESVPRGVAPSKLDRDFSPKRDFWL